MRRVVLCALAVFMEDEPIAGRSVDIKDHIACDIDVIIVLIDLSGCVAFNIFAIAISDCPSLEMVFFALDGIRHVHFIWLRCSCRIGPESYLLLPERDFVFIIVSDAVVFEEHRIVCDWITVCSRRQHGIHICTNIFNAFCLRFCRIRFIRSPSAEVYAGV